jgi:hypothetical protein
MLTLKGKEKLKNFEDPDCITSLYKIHEDNNLDLLEMDKI